VADRQDSDREVLTSLPRTRPVRRSAKRTERPRTAATATKPKSTPAATASTDAPKARKPATKPRAAAQPKATARTASRPRSADGATSQRTRTASRQTVPPAGYASPPTSGDDGQRSPSADLLGTAVQAAGELAQIGFAVGRQALQSMLDRLPKP
jgi:histone H1/5